MDEVGEKKGLSMNTTQKTKTCGLMVIH